LSNITLFASWSKVYANPGTYIQSVSKVDPNKCSYEDGLCFYTEFSLLPTVQIRLTAFVWLQAASAACISGDYEKVLYEIRKPDIFQLHYLLNNLFKIFKITLTISMRFKKLWKINYFTVQGLASHWSCFQILKTEYNLLYIRNQSVPRCKHFPKRLFKDQT